MFKKLFLSCLAIATIALLVVAGCGKKNPEVVNQKDSSVLIEIPAGSFIMGSNDYDDEKPIHTVYLDKYYIGKYEVTVGQFRKFVNATGYKTDAEKSGGAYVYTGGSWQQKADANWKNPYFSQNDNSPVVCVSWNDAKAYCDWAGLRLPTEAEWEKAARGTDGRSYPWGNGWDGNKCNHGKVSSPYTDASDGYEYTSPVGSFSSGVSPYGAYDMAGNVWEWCSDWYGENYYGSSPSNNPTGPSSGDSRVLRGGSFGSYANDSVCRVAARIYNLPDYRTNYYGFRIAQ
ncbi:formylglycine-generating enzyme family protein [candidate division TA06 bacterium]|uniref:Formylglycine-generating enzyme family protein n=1 Tax=candidate division TA06 bacterium TaxID=2250710 RepID=A0A933I7S0_UNCT6|nr:formylglycine-generating enzyme family protein [candidate division TA06 bacterium]